MIVVSKGVSKRKTAISVKIALRLKKVCYKVSLCENCQRQSCKAFIGLTNRAKNDWWGATPSTWNLDQSDRVGAKSPIFDLFFARRDSAVTPSDNSSINTNRKSTTRLPMSPRWTSYIVPNPLPPKGGSENAVSKIWTISCNNSETLRDRMSVTINH